MKVSKTERIALLKSRRAIEEQRMANETIQTTRISIVSIDIIFTVTVLAMLLVNMTVAYYKGAGLKSRRDKRARQESIKWLFGAFVVSPTITAICLAVLPDGTIKEIIKFVLDWAWILMEV